MNEQGTQSRLGVSKLEFFFSSHGWLFREQFQHDYGIDAQIEIATNKKPTGALIGIQIKSGPSYLKEQTKEGFIYRFDDSHFKYWTGYSLPVIVVLYDPKAEILYWESVEKDKIVSTGKGWKITIPREKTLTNDSLLELSLLTQPPPYIQKLNKLRLDKRWIDLVAANEQVFIEFDDWINKSLPRFQLRIGCDSRDDIRKETWPMIYSPGLSVEEFISYVVPWADYTVDEDAYQDYMESVWSSECYGGHDSETDTVYYTESFEEWYKPPEGLVSVSTDGEVETYRLLLSLNKIGKSFLNLDEFLSEEDPIEDRIFTLEP